jgi:hypothetical protein
MQIIRALRKLICWHKYEDGFFWNMCGLDNAITWEPMVGLYCTKCGSFIEDNMLEESKLE